MNLTDIYITFHPKAAKYTFFSGAHGTFSRIDHILGHKQVLINLRRLKSYPASFSNHNYMKLEINYKKKTGKFTNMWRLNNMLLNNQWVKEEIKREIKKCLVWLQMANRHMKRCSTLLIIREMQIKTTMRYHLTPVRMAIIKKSTNNTRWRGCAEKGTLLHCSWECKLVQPLWKTVQRFLRKLKVELPYDPAIPLTPGHIPRQNYNSKRYMHPQVPSSTIHNSQDMEIT